VDHISVVLEDFVHLLLERELLELACAHVGVYVSTRSSKKRPKLGGHCAIPAELAGIWATIPRGTTELLSSVAVLVVPVLRVIPVPSAHLITTMSWAAVLARWTVELHNRRHAVLRTPIRSVRRYLTSIRR
jgi:hypothetical protein